MLLVNNILLGLMIFLPVLDFKQPGHYFPKNMS